MWGQGGGESVTYQAGRVLRRFASGELVDTPSLGRALQSASSALGLLVELK